MGDIHGCFDEFRELLDSAGVTQGDRIVAVGDIVDRGPQSPQVLEFFRLQPGATSVMGNHEREHLRASRGEGQLSLSQILAREQFGTAYPEAVEYMAQLPLFLDLSDAVVVHAYLEPDVALEQQQPRVLAGTMTGEKYSAARYGRPWYELYKGDRPLIVGHFDYLRSGAPFVYRDRVFAIDTSCCRGRRLTGLLLSDFRFVSVPARRDYWREARETCRQAGRAAMPVEPWTWEQIRQHLSSLGPGDESPGADRLRHLLQQAEDELPRVYDFLRREAERIVSELRHDQAFCDLSPFEQARAFALKAKKSRWAKYLHRLVRGKLTPEALRGMLKGSSALLGLASKIFGAAGTSEPG